MTPDARYSVTLHLDAEQPVTIAPSASEPGAVAFWFGPLCILGPLDVLQAMVAEARNGLEYLRLRNEAAA